MTDIKSRQSTPFSFTPENEEKAKTILRRYPEGREASAVLPLLWLAQKQGGGWLPVPAIEYVAHYVNLAPIRVLEVASFYSMFNTEPVGRYHIQICRTTPCWLRGADNLTKACTRKLGVALGETTPDGLFSMMEVECLGACVNAPVVQINDDYYEDLDPDALSQVLDHLAAGEAVALGSVTGRQGSAPSESSPAQLERALKPVIGS